MGSIPIGRANFDGPLNWVIGKSGFEPQAGSNPVQPGNWLTTQLVSCPSRFYRAESRRLSNSMVEFRPARLELQVRLLRPTRSLARFFFAAMCLTFSTGRRIGLSLPKRVVAGSSPAFGTIRRSSSVVEHVFPIRFLSVVLETGPRSGTQSTINRSLQ